MTEQLKWYKTSEKKPEYKEFGKSPEVLGIDDNLTRHIYIYEKGDWSVKISSHGIFVWREVDAPLYWHYLLSREGLTR